jgi:hypothetical protein
VEILTGELLVLFVAAAVVIWSYSLFLLVAPAESSGLELLPRTLGIGDGDAQPFQRGFELAQTPVPPLEFVNADLGRGEPLEDGFQSDRHQSGMSCVAGTIAS